MIKKLSQILLVIIVLQIMSGCKNNSVDESITGNSIENIGYKYIKSFPHDTSSFTEGFVIYNGKLFESTGSPESFSYARSVVGVVDQLTGKIDEKVVLKKDRFFGEGITFLNGKLFQLTYKSRVGFVYDAKTFEKINEFNIPSEEGWGLTTDGESLIMSDGTYLLTFLDSVNFEVTKTIDVTQNGIAKNHLNELEFINGYIYANIWPTSTIVKINPENGKVVGIINLDDFSNEASHLYPLSLEMNGIAYDDNTNQIYLTGKFWPRIYQIELFN